MHGLSFTLALLLAGPTVVDHQPSRLTLVVDNVRNPNGVIGALVFASPNGWPEATASALAKKSVPAHTGVAVISFENLPPGDYAVVVLHDENEDMKLDRNAFGKPREGWGMSNNPKAHLSAPPFSAARFTFNGDARLSIHLKY